MIIWLASYPKSGNTWLRALISSYYYSNDGVFNQELLKKIDQFPTKKYFDEFDYNKKVATDTCKLWIKAHQWFCFVLIIYFLSSSLRVFGTASYWLDIAEVIIIITLFINS